jgi:Isochorismatase family
MESTIKVPGSHARLTSGVTTATENTEYAIDSPLTIIDARAAYERGYELTIVTDAITDRDQGPHLNSLKAIFPRIAELATTDEILTALERRDYQVDGEADSSLHE